MCMSRDLNDSRIPRILIYCLNYFDRGRFQHFQRIDFLSDILSFNGQSRRSIFDPVTRKSHWFSCPFLNRVSGSPHIGRNSVPNTMCI